MILQGRKIVVGVTGGIAAYKSVELVRELGRRGAEVRVVMTHSAERFVGRVTFTGITGRPALVDLWDPSYPGEVHVELGAWADLLLVAPATAHFLSRAANGSADDLLTATLLCTNAPVAVAPAMHHRMWKHDATQANVATLAARGVHFIGPVHGALASGEEGLGRLADPLAIADAAAALLEPKKDLTGRTIVVSAGPTYEDLDPVRFLGNRSTGKMGFAVAARASARGARVVLVAGPVTLTAPPHVERVDVRSALEMRDALVAASASADAVVMTAAVADYRAVEVATEKQKKSAGDTLSIELAKNPDILAELGAARTSRRPVLVGFAVETSDLEGYARRKLRQKRVDFVVANLAADGFGGSDNVACIVDETRAETLTRMSKLDLADVILDRVLALLQT